MKALLMVGSPRQKGASRKLGNALLENLADCGLDTQAINLVHGLGESWAELEAAVASADLLILSFPLYADTLPAPTTAALVRLLPNLKGKQLAVIINCGFPEGYHNNTALKVCQQFAREAECKWMGALTLGMGGFSFGKGVARPVGKGMKLAAQALSQGMPIPDKAAKLASRLPMPKWMYLFVLNRTFKRIVGKHGKAPIDAQPYL